jgi:hypothetical protein
MIKYREKVTASSESSFRLKMYNTPVKTTRKITISNEIIFMIKLISGLLIEK